MVTDVLERIVSGATKNDQLHELLAWNWKAAREAETNRRGMTHELFSYDEADAILRLDGANDMWHQRD